MRLFSVIYPTKIILSALISAYVT